MINWEKTEQLFGYSENDRIPKTQKVVCQCDVCGAEKLATKHYHYRGIKRSGKFRCKQCGREESRNKISESIKSKWKDQEYKQKQVGRTHTEKLKTEASKRALELWGNEKYRAKYLKGFDPEIARGNLNAAREKSREKSRERLKKLWRDNDYRQQMQKRAKANWEDNDYREAITSKLKAHYEDPEVLEIASIRAQKLWQDERYRDNITSKIRKRWQDERYKTKMAKIMANRPKVSALQETLYSILDDLNINYYKERNDESDDQECIIGPWSFDCVIPTDNKILLIDCHGDYYHSQEKQMQTDRAKATYISRHFEEYDYKIIWEHEFKCRDKVVELVKYWTGITKLTLIDFDFDDVVIKICPSKDYRLLLSKYHYLPNAGRGGVAYGAYLRNRLIAVSVFSPLGRQNMPWDKESTRELSRLCIHPRCQKQNFASWFVSRCIKSLDLKYSTIISYCDTTFNHDGAVYKACNFILDGEVKPDYWYISEDGWIMHKKTLYNHAVKMGVRENDYAEINGYKKVYGKEKLRFVYERK